MTENQNDNVQEVNLSIEHIFVLYKAVELAATRGAFQASEMSKIGIAYDQVSTFLSGFESRKQEAEQVNPTAGQEQPVNGE
jgi:hypothetical protein